MKAESHETRSRNRKQDSFEFFASFLVTAGKSDVLSSVATFHELFGICSIIIYALAV